MQVGKVSASTAFTFVLTMGIPDMTYEAARASMVRSRRCIVICSAGPLEFSFVLEFRGVLQLVFRYIHGCPPFAVGLVKSDAHS